MQRRTSSSCATAGACLDTGHAFLSGGIQSLAKKLRGHLKIIHAYDNGGTQDDHFAPGDGRIDWEAILRDLVEIEFPRRADSGDGRPKDANVTMTNARRGQQYLREVARRIALSSTSNEPFCCETIMKKILIYTTAFATRLSLLVAQTPPNTGVRQFPPQTTAMKGVLVPVPREIFDTLDKFAHSNWRAVQRPELAQWRPHGDQAEIALLLGAVIAEGFIAVEAEDAAEVKSVGRAVLKLARGLGVEKAALRRSRSIVEHAERGDWPGVRKEWDGVLPDVQRGMNELKSEQLAQLVSLGGWLRGTEALTALVLQNYSHEDAELLRQPALLDYFEKQLAGMSGDIRTNPIIVRMREGIQKIRPLVASEDAQISQKR